MTLPPLPSGLIRGVVIMTLLTGTTIIIGCRRPDGTAFTAVTPGMSKAEVLERLGQPSSRVKGDLARNNATWASRWHWGDTLGDARHQRGDARPAATAPGVDCLVRCFRHCDQCRGT